MTQTTLNPGCCEVEMIETLGFEWVRPNNKIDADMASNFNRFQGVSIQTSAGILVLAKVEKFSTPTMGGIRRVLVGADELNTADETR